ncbi:aminotransferase class I/II-fold pyridoxal phosphate-dependent enzyme [Virgibacillus sp. 179-BFC.A HS]|uniref:Aminotransferase n=1 Tax=Tigheibacillus jepli TaxID=3035914 RepID=A0ABU5CM02_9BACI|nr:aminotransferase class I/II-fold pyridoxal phosphate-dependent enzyme [Virgibacillus sp. 179-BFC.A HS]MDY0406842.1 aminotransferase class I/II-fold pyridoxal phosphate-dependent enzyme [Virgibacillus sp. 179-BFC.A HS]
MQARGVDVIDLGIGAPDLPTPAFIIDALAEAARLPANHRYSSYYGCREFREAVASFYRQRYGVELNPDTEVLTLIGSKEGIAHLIQAVVNPGETVLVPNPGYPVYRSAVHLSGAKAVDLPLDATNGYAPKFSDVKKSYKDAAKLMLLNYPANPTAATIELSTYLEAVAFSKENQLLLANDMAYDLITFRDYQSPSVLQVPDAKDVAIEFGSLSKSFNMTGWRIGYAVGNKDAIKALSTLKSNLDSSQFLPIQLAAARALESDLAVVKKHATVFEKRMEKMHAALQRLGISAEKPRGTIFLWVQVPKPYTSAAFAEKLLEDAGIIITPGTAFGTAGEGYARIALTVDEQRLDEAIIRLEQLDIKGGNGT